MRYQIRNTRDGFSTLQAKTREAADILFQDQQDQMQPGETLTLVDTKQASPTDPTMHKVLRTHRVYTEAEKQEASNAALERMLETMLGKRAVLVAFTKKMTEQLDNDPAYELRWGDNVFAAAAEYELALQVRHYRVDNNVGWDAILDQLRKEVFREARSMSSSTSVCSNLMESARLAARASMVEQIESCLRW